MARYDNSNIRRQDRLLDEKEAMALLEAGEYGVMSMVADGMPYAVPVSYAYDGSGAIYVHCAPEGEKLEALRKCGDVVFVVVGKTEVLPSKFTTRYESILVRGTARTGLDEAERYRALDLILKKYSPDDYETGRKYAAASFHRTEIIRIDVETVSGKTKR